jgi:hypothetical protein
VNARHDPRPDRYVPLSLWSWLEREYGAPIAERARLDGARTQPEAWRDGGASLLMSDHGVVHVSFVVRATIDVLERADGLLVPSRPPHRLEWMRALGAYCAFLHDIGLADPSPGARDRHAGYVVAALQSRELDPVVETIVRDDPGGLASRLSALATSGALPDAEAALREVLSLAACHSKSAVPFGVLNDAAALAHAMRTMAGREAPAWSWLADADARLSALAADAVDTVRALRAADALRERGLVHKTSGGYEVFVDRATGMAVHALRLRDERLYLVTSDDPHSAGEANIAASTLTPEGDLRIAFHSGAFGCDEAQTRAVAAAALIVGDVQGDVIGSFTPPADACRDGLRPHAEMRILLESAHDDPAFSEQVARSLVAREPGLATRVRVVPSLTEAAEGERTRYLAAPPFTGDAGARAEVIARLASSGQLPPHDLDAAFEHVRTVSVTPGETLLVAETPAGFVYVPLDEGMVVRPLGGFGAFPVRPFIPLGVTGVIRGGARNADVIAAAPVRLLAIPKSVYLRHWYRPHSLESLRDVLGQ